MAETSVPSVSGVVDALPYVDAGYDAPGVREAVIALVEDEMKRFRPSRDYLHHLPPLDLKTFQTDTMKIESKRMDESKPMDKLDFKKYTQTKPAVNRRRDPAAWEECFNRVAVLHNHMTNRLANLQLQSEYGAEVWRRYIPVMERQFKLAEAELKDLNWVNLVAKNVEIERSCLEMEANIVEWERYHEAVKMQRQQQQDSVNSSKENDTPSVSVEDLATNTVENTTISPDQQASVTSSS